jgi:hypothetical protein
MRKIYFALGLLLLFPICGLSQDTVSPAEKPENKMRWLVGFSGIYPTGTWPATALSNMGNSSFLKGQGHPVRTYGFGVLIQAEVAKNIYVFLDGNAYNYNFPIAEQGTDAQSVWTVEESATHWDEPGAPQIQYVHNLPTDVYFDMQSTGFRIGAKYAFMKGNIRPWLGGGFGFYEWQVNYCTKEKDKTYGKDKGFATGFSLMGGIDFEPFTGTVFTLFADLGSPVANYKIEGLFYPQWNIDYNAHIMGTSRFGLSVSFEPVRRIRKG